MKYKLFITVLMVCFWVCQAQNVIEEFRVNKSEIAKYGINYDLLHPANLSADGDMFVCTEMVSDVKKKLEGFARILHIMHFKDKKLAKIDSVPLPLGTLINVQVSDTKKEVWIIGDYGNKIFRIDATVSPLKIETLFQYKKGTAGFKSGPFLLCHRGIFYATGWFYDANQVWKGDWIVELRPDKKGGLTFERKVDLKKLYEEDYGKEGQVLSFCYVSGDYFYFNLVKPKEKKTYLLSYRNGRVEEVDKGNFISVFMGSDDKVFYIVREDEKTLHHYLKDFAIKDKSKSITKIGQDGAQYTYPFVCKDTLVVIDINMKRKRLSAFYGLKKDNYKLQRFILNETLGPIKLSYNARVYLMMTPELLRIGTLPAGTPETPNKPK